MGGADRVAITRGNDATAESLHQREILRVKKIIFKVCLTHCTHVMKSDVCEDTGFFLILFKLPIKKATGNIAANRYMWNEAVKETFLYNSEKSSQIKPVCQSCPCLSD